MKKFVVLFLFVFTLSTRGLAEPTYPFPTVKQQAQFNYLLTELRCLVCQNQNLADSNAGIAQDLREQVYLLVKEGNSDQEIIHYLTQRYGDFILFNPPVKPITALLWFGPLFFLVLGLFIFWRTCLRRIPHE